MDHGRRTAPLHSRFVRELRSLLRGVAAMSAQVAPFEQDMAGERAQLWTRVSLPLCRISRRNGDIQPVQQLRLFCGFAMFDWGSERSEPLVAPSEGRRATVEVEQVLGMASCLSRLALGYALTGRSI